MARGGGWGAGVASPLQGFGVQGAACGCGGHGGGGGGGRGLLCTRFACLGGIRSQLGGGGRDPMRGLRCNPPAGFGVQGPRGGGEYPRGGAGTLGGVARTLWRGAGTLGRGGRDPMGEGRDPGGEGGHPAAGVQ